MKKNAMPIIFDFGEGKYTGTDTAINYVMYYNYSKLVNHSN